MTAIALVLHPKDPTREIGKLIGLGLLLGGLGAIGLGTLFVIVDGRKEKARLKVLDRTPAHLRQILGGFLVIEGLLVLGYGVFIVFSDRPVAIAGNSNDLGVKSVFSTVGALSILTGWRVLRR